MLGAVFCGVLCGLVVVTDGTRQDTSASQVVGPIVSPGVRAGRHPQPRTSVRGEREQSRREGPNRQEMKRRTDQHATGRDAGDSRAERRGKRPASPGRPSDAARRFSKGPRRPGPGRSDRSRDRGAPRLTRNDHLRMAARHLQAAGLPMAAERIHRMMNQPGPGPQRSDAARRVPAQRGVMPQAPGQGPRLAGDRRPVAADVPSIQRLREDVQRMEAQMQRLQSQMEENLARLQRATRDQLEQLRREWRDDRRRHDQERD